MIRRLLLALAPLMIAAPAAAQESGHHHGAAATQAQVPAASAAPPAPTDHVADRYWDPVAMHHAREMAREEMGGMRFSKVMLNLAEYRTGAKGDAYHWDGEAWYGGDYNRLVLRSEGEGAVREGLESAEVQALYSRAVGRYTDLRAGLRQDFSPHARTYLAVGAESLLPYWFDVEGSAFLSTEGEVLVRAEGSYDLRLFQRVVLQPRAELNFAAQNSPETRTGQGLSSAELGLRLRYEIRREFAPYIGVSWERRFGRTADYARDEGDAVEATSLVMGLRAWF
ncbi:copper resistance protein B [Phenylobacterium sp. LjRoot225]|uniref:copper resistance protein B n=1 Tax=Phenylobacterium sp. LjRoot225 TaxID=3342285 RepID=UPI003ECF3CAF